MHRWRLTFRGLRSDILQGPRGTIAAVHLKLGLLRGALRGENIYRRKSLKYAERGKSSRLRKTGGNAEAEVGKAQRDLTKTKREATYTAKRVIVRSVGAHSAGTTPGSGVLALNLLACTERSCC